MNPRSPKQSYPTSKEDVAAARRDVETPQTVSPAYRLSYTDIDFLTKEELRPVRLQLELLKPELLQQEHGIDGTVVVFGGSRIPEYKVAAEDLARAEKAVAADPTNPGLQRQVAVARRVVAKSHYYEEARRLGALLSEICDHRSGCNLVVITGGGPGIMEAANRGAYDIGAKTMGLNIVLPHEQAPNPYISPELCFQFHYFSIRKMHFLMRAQALVAFPGGFGTLDELFETLTLIQTKKIKPLPVLLFGREFWQKVIDFDFLVEEGVVSPDDLDIFQYVETAEDAATIIENFYIRDAGD
ncbi:MAG: hypothetical protein VR65_02800 [Desulfobulbaceae bacterium BRH_c16a]|nr:MAG: hypothetical protein VR65_02800 [Desulfobulbaceae bacterium BRH_c16a]